MPQPQGNMEPRFVEVSRTASGLVVSLRGSWRLPHVRAISEQLEAALPSSGLQSVRLDAASLEEVDTSGALAVLHQLSKRGADPGDIELANADSDHQAIFALVAKNLAPAKDSIRTKQWGVFERIGFSAFSIAGLAREILTFVGQTAVEACRTILHPRRLRVRELFVQLERVCVDAVPITALVTFLIGIVVAYLFSIQSEKYGANIFIVDAVALAMCRELSPIIVAIIVAGRSGSAFTAQIGAMKITEEIDALETLGLAPMRVLVMPRFFALVAAMPLLVFVGDVVSIYGAMLVADFRLDITLPTFIERLGTVLPVKSFLVGIVKAPVFAAFIAIIGCRMGLTVSRNARSLGMSTTSTVVQSVVSVILLNAAFAIIFTELGI
ncbi:MAG: MlaE family lipid ABC transporter permease subunit [Bdellovibrionales bacterium]|nr:MlaE family lipid ABC transporter permease subunit [Bdellovibrionales bacterium]